MSASGPQFSADLSAGSLLLAESRRIAGLLLRTPTVTEWEHAFPEPLERTPGPLD